MKEAPPSGPGLPAAGSRPTAARSVAAILRNQHAGGAFIASPDFAQYRYCWLRDGAFTAYALDRAGQHEASRRFHDWCGSAVSATQGLMTAAMARQAAGLAVDADQMPPARFRLDGGRVQDDWPNFQLDGYGTWLWALRQHLLIDGERALPAELVPAVECTASYLAALGTSPCYDVWEEAGDHVHTVTLACVYAGLVAAGELLGDPSLGQQAEPVLTGLLEQGRRRGHFSKWDGNDQVDGSLLWLCRPFGLVSPGDVCMAETARRISDELDLEGGTRRYPADVYYGSGAWPVLTASLGWYYAASGDLRSAQSKLQWVTDRVDEEGRLAEQYGGEARDPAHYREWVQRWGPPAADLVWSHAMYVVLASELQELSSTAGAPGTPEPPRSPVAQPKKT